MKNFVATAIAVTCIASGAVNASGFATDAVPTSVTIVQSTGFVIAGPFGNPNSCQRSNELLIKSDHPQYKQLYATAITAFLSKKKLRAYADGCDAAPFISPNTMNYVTSYLGIKE